MPWGTFKLAELKTKAQVCRTFVDDCTARHLRGELDVATAAMAKYHATDLQCALIDECLQVFGGYGYMWEDPIARLYADLVEDQAVRDEVFAAIEAAFRETVHWATRIAGQRNILDNDPTLQRSIRLRNPYVDPLNFLQVRLLRQLRQATAADEEQTLQEALYITINGIAAGLKNTG